MLWQMPLSYLYVLACTFYILGKLFPKSQRRCLQMITQSHPLELNKHICPLSPVGITAFTHRTHTKSGSSTFHPITWQTEVVVKAGAGCFRELAAVHSDHYRQILPASTYDYAHVRMKLSACVCMYVNVNGSNLRACGKYNICTTIQTCVEGRKEWWCVVHIRDSNSA